MSLPIDSQITFLYTENLAKSAPFYEDVLGLPLAVDQGSCRIYRIVGSQAYIGLCERAEPRTKDGLIFTIVTQDVDGWYERITSKGITCEYPPKLNETYHIYHFFVRDPSGYLIEVQRFATEDWDQSKSSEG